MGKSLVKQIEELTSPTSEPSKLDTGRLKKIKKRGYRGASIKRSSSAIYRELPVANQAMLYR